VREHERQSTFNAYAFEHLLEPINRHRGAIALAGEDMLRADRLVPLDLAQRCELVLAERMRGA